MLSWEARLPFFVGADVKKPGSARALPGFCILLREWCLGPEHNVVYALAKSLILIRISVHEF